MTPEQVKGLRFCSRLEWTLTETFVADLCARFYAPGVQQRGSGRASVGLDAALPVVHQSAHQLVRDHHVEQEDEYGGVHSDMTGW